MVTAADKQYNATQLEARVRARWTDAKAYEATRRHRQGGTPWYFIDGPPYATGSIHMGTARNKVLKDAVVRWMSMRGREVRDQPGYDEHGLPIEVKVEKELGFQSKKDIEAFGIDRFVERCRKFALDHEATMTEEFKELGVWMDWERPYRTLANEYIEGAWWAIAKANERGLLFESERVLTWCWRCETPLANAEIEFENRRDPSLYVKFPVRGKPGEFLLIWTTTPWTLPANVAIAANPDLEYARVRYERPGAFETIVVVAEQAEHVAKLGGYEAFQIVERFKGTHLEGLRYDHPFASEVPFHQTPPAEAMHTVILGAHVLGDRTGLVHNATGHGVEDFEAGKRYGIPVFSPVGEDGRYTDDAGAFQGLPVKGAREGERSADAVVIDSLKRKGLLLAERSEEHAYGHCWRCKNPIVYRATRQWFIDVAKIQGRMIEEVQRVNWTPEWAGSARQMDWVKNAKDWCISRQRYWGIPLPVWKCEGCNGVTVISSRADLAKQSTGYAQGMDLHRPWIDNVALECECGGEKRRVADVLDVWFDSAVASWAELGWPSEKRAFEKWWPCDWICEGLDQTRGWFYSQLGASVAALDRVPYDAVLMHGWVHDEQGRPFSKSLGNGFPPGDVVKKYGADALRFTTLAQAAPWEDLSMGVETARGAQRFLNILWNVHVFATQYMALDGFDPEKTTRASLDKHLRVEDRWLYSRLATVTRRVHVSLEAMEIHQAAREIERFVLEDVSRWYVRLARDRTWTENPAEAKDKLAAYRTMYDALMTVAKLSAPFTPFVADAIYHDLGGALATVHMEDWPEAREGDRDEDLEHGMTLAQAIVEAAANARQKANMKLRWPVAALTIATDDARAQKAAERLRDVILDQANAKELRFVSKEWEALELVPAPNKQAIGRTYRSEGPRVIQHLQSLNQSELRDLRRRFAAGEIVPVRLGFQTFKLEPHIVAFDLKLPAHVTGADFTHGAIYIDTEFPAHLKAEGYARDLIRRIQETRKEAKLPVAEQIVTEIAMPEEARLLVEREARTIARETRTARLTFTPEPQGEVVRAWDLEGEQVLVAIRPATATEERESAALAVDSAEPEARGERAPALSRATAKSARATKPAQPKTAKAPSARAPAKKAAPARKPAKRAPAKKPAKKLPKKAPAKPKAAKGKPKAKATSKKSPKRAAAKKPTKKTGKKKR